MGKPASVVEWMNPKKGTSGDLLESKNLTDQNGRVMLSPTIMVANRRPVRKNGAPGVLKEFLNRDNRDDRDFVFDH